MTGVLPSNFYGLAISFYNKAISCCTLVSANESDIKIDQGDRTWVEEQNQGALQKLLGAISDVSKLQAEENQRADNRAYHLPIEVAWPGNNQTIFKIEELIPQIREFANDATINPSTFHAVPSDNAFDLSLSDLLKDVTDSGTLTKIASYLGKTFAENTRKSLGEQYKNVRFFLFPLQSFNSFIHNDEAIEAFRKAFVNELQLDHEIDIALGTARPKNPHFFNVVKPIMRERIRAIKT